MNKFRGERRIDMYAVTKYVLRYDAVKTGLSAAIREGRVIATSYDVYKFCKRFFAHTPIERCVCIALDGGHRIIGIMVQDGTHNMAAVYIREIFAFLFSSGATAFTMCHNHTGGDKTPSKEDWFLTKTLRQAGRLLTVELLDHIIVTDTVTSMRDLPQWGKI